MLKLIVIMIIIQCFANAYMQTELINPNNRFGNQMNKFERSPLSNFGSKITLMRHANTFNNINQIWTGQLDIPIVNSNQDKIFMSDYDLVLCSSAIRCRQTLDLMEFSNRPKIIFDDSLLEAGYGEFTGTIKTDSYKRNFFNKQPESKYYISESIFEAGFRSYMGFSMLSDPYLYENSEILILSHRNTLKGLWTFLNLDNILTFENEEEIDNIERNIMGVLEKSNPPEFENLVKYHINL